AEVELAPGPGRDAAVGGRESRRGRARGSAASGRTRAARLGPPGLDFDYGAAGPEGRLAVWARRVLVLLRAQRPRRLAPVPPARRSSGTPRYACRRDRSHPRTRRDR